MKTPKAGLAIVASSVLLIVATGNEILGAIGWTLLALASLSELVSG